LSANAEDRLAANGGFASARIVAEAHEVLIETAELIALLPVLVLVAKVLYTAIGTTVLALLLGLLRLLDNNNHESPVRAELPYGILMLSSCLFGEIGSPCRVRTSDIHIQSVALYQLS
jgi:hypothetical protein